MNFLLNYVREYSSPGYSPKLNHIRSDNECNESNEYVATNFFDSRHSTLEHNEHG